MASVGQQSQVTKNVDILSFDGGGSRGVMEAVILDDIMKLVTLLIEDPVAIQEIFYGYRYNYQDFKEGIEEPVPSVTLQSESDWKPEPQKIRELLDNDSTIPNPERAADHFDMIVGTSTGALIAFGLVGGNVDADGKTRIPMSAQEIIPMYKMETGGIFGKRDTKDCPSMVRFLIWLKDKLGLFPDLNLRPYSQDGLVNVLNRKFGDLEVDDIVLRNPDGSWKCIAAAVARRLKESLDESDELVIFDSLTSIPTSVVDVLKASACAPVFFRGPSKIDNRNYVDGGLGGNCPLKQAFARMKELDETGSTKIQLVVSIAPPKIAEPKKLAALKSYEHFSYWLRYCITQFTNGQPVFHDVRKEEKEATLFHRVCPVSDKSRKFKMDELDVNAMVKAVHQESISDMSYFEHTLAIAASILLSSKSQRVGHLTESQALILFKLLSDHICDNVKEEFVENLSKACQMFLTKLDASTIIDETIKKDLREDMKSRLDFVNIHLHPELKSVEFFKKTRSISP